jgi:hypothetical protein
MAVSGHNGNNETLIGFSTSISLTLYDEAINEIPITRSNTLIDIVIPRDKDSSEYSYQYVNITEKRIKPGSFYLPNSFKITTNNASIHIELNPLNKSLGYFLVMKLGYTPIVNSTYSDYTSFELMCPSNY